MPDLTLIAGSNGAGKSSLTRQLSEEGNLLYGVPVIDPDQIAREARPEAPERAAFTAGREAIRRASGYLERGESFAVETTLSGHRGLRLLSEAKEGGFLARLIYVGLESAELAKGRVEQRVREGGHDIPPEAIRRRYHRSLANLPEALSEASEALVFDNSTMAGHRAALLVRGGRVVSIYKPEPAWLARALPQPPGGGGLPSEGEWILPPSRS